MGLLVCVVFAAGGKQHSQEVDVQWGGSQR
jgi:hypothetical protein